MSSSPRSATGFWTGVYFGGAAKFCAGRKGEDIGSEEDKTILNTLAGKIRRLSERSRESEKRHLWYDHNDLKEKYPVVLADPENGWNEIITEDMLECKGNLAKRWEWILRREVFWGENVLDDRPIEGVFEIGYTHTDSEWGIDVVYHGGEHGTSYMWEPGIANSEDIDKIQDPKIEIDYETTENTLNIAKSVLGDELEVKLRGLNWHSPHMSRDLAKMVGLEAMMIMMHDDPDTIHAIMQKFLRGHLARLDFLEEEGLLTLNNDHSYVGSGGIGYTCELPRRELDANGPVRTEDLWLHTESQETVGVSPEMFEEFILRYQTPLPERFGLTCYGCREPLDNRWHIVSEIPNLRRVSISAWADEEKMAANLGDAYIYSRKSNPADLANHEMDEESARESIRKTLEITKGGCIVEIVMKDNHTIGNNPGNITRWVQIAREEIERMYGRSQQMSENDAGTIGYGNNKRVRLASIGIGMSGHVHAEIAAEMNE